VFASSVVGQRFRRDVGRSRAIFTNILDLFARVVAIQGGKARSMNSSLDPRDGSAPLLVNRADFGSPAGRLEAHKCASPSSEPRSAVRRHAAALSDGHVSQDDDRLAFTRARRAAAARDVRSVGTPAPLPKYISSGVWPRNAECGRTLLCSPT
jgi:hypothetical protein